MWRETQAEVGETMRIYENCKQAINEVTRELFSRGVVAFDPTWQGKRVDEKEFSAKELLGTSYMISTPNDPEELFAFSKANFKTCQSIEHAKAWSEQRLSKPWENPEQCHEMPAVKDYWDALKESNGQYSYTYSERMLHWKALAQKLKSNPYMRGCYMTIFETTRDFSNIGKRRVPCSLGYQFVIRPHLGRDQLYIIYLQRSCDLVNHYATDVYCALDLQNRVAREVGVEPGPFMHFVTNLHAFRKDVSGDRQW